jgi:hypothetical protein
MKCFFAENIIINMNTICALDIKNGIVTMIGGHTVTLTIRETKNLVDVLTEVHRNECI